MTPSKTFLAIAAIVAAVLSLPHLCHAQSVDLGKPGSATPNYEAVLNEIRWRTMESWNRPDELEPYYEAEERQEFVKLTEQDKATIQKINELALKDEYKFNAEWIKELLTEERFVYGDGTEPFVRENLPGLILQLAKHSPMTFLRTSRLFSQTYDYSFFPAELRLQIVRDAIAAIPSGLGDDQKMRAVQEIVNRTNVYRWTSPGKTNDFDAIFSLLEQYVQSQFKINKNSFRFYGQILANQSSESRVPTLDEIHAGNAAPVYIRLVQSMEARRFRGDWIKKLIGIVGTRTNEQWSVANHAGLAFDESANSFNPSRREEYLRELAHYIDNRYAAPNPCNFALRVRTVFRKAGYWFFGIGG